MTGVWRLTGLEHRLRGGAVTYPLGPAPIGMLIYATNGCMSVAIMRRQRTEFQSAGLFAGTPEEKSLAFDEYVSYGGRYRIEGDAVIHEVEFSLFPNLVGTSVTRHFFLEEDVLILSTEVFSWNSIDQAAYLTWKRS